MENFTEWLSPTLDINYPIADSHKASVIDHYDFFPIQQVQGLCPAEDCVAANYSKFDDCQEQVCQLNFEDLQSKKISSCSPKLFSMKPSIDIPSSTSCNNAESSQKVTDYYCFNPVNEDSTSSLNNNMNYFNNVSLFDISSKETNEKSGATINKENVQFGNIQYLNLNKCLQNKIVPSTLNKTPGAILSNGVQTVPHLMPTVGFSNTFEDLDKSFLDRGVFKPSRYLLPTFSSLPYSTRNVSKKNTMEKITKRVPVSIKARNAKFLCSEKDLRSWTVRELLETCETIQENIVNKKVFSDGRMVTQPKLASNCNHLNAQEPFPTPLNICNHSRFCEENLFKENQKNLNEINGNLLSSGTNTVDPTSLEVLSVDNISSNSNNYPERLPPMQNLEDFGSVSSVPIKVYQPTSDYQKFVKSKHPCENKIPRPKHFDFCFLQIRNFKYFCTDSNFKRTSKLKVIFSKKKLVYEFQVGETTDSSGSYTKHLAIIEVDFNTIVAIWGQGDKFRLQVKVPPHMYVGTHFCNNKSQHSSTQNVQYDRTHTTDLTCGELYQIPFHYIQLRSMCVNNLLACLCQFSPRFEMMLRCPFIETITCDKMLPQQGPVISNFIPDIQNESLSTCQNSQDQNVEFSENIFGCYHHIDSPQISCNMCSTMVETSFDDV